MQFHVLNIQNKTDFDFVIELYLTSFPPSERRTVLDMINTIENVPNFTIYLIYDNNEPIGFISLWKFEKFIYLEHFAINSKSRNGGYGKKVLEYLISQEKLPLVGEIELPSSSEIALRRQDFYKRQGFRVWDNIDYYQPNFVKNEGSIPMLLISHGNVNLRFLEKTVKYTLYKEVYKK